MMTTYFQGVSDIQPTSDNLQTLYLMNPNNYLPSCSEQTHTPQTTPSMLLLNPSHALGQGSIPHAPQHLLGIPLPGPHPDNPNRPSYHYNLWDPTAIPPTMDSPMGFRRPTSGPHTQGLSLSLSPHQRPNHPSAVITTAGGGGGGGGSSVSNGVEGMILGSKYLKATQELLDEVVSVGSNNKKAVIVDDDNNHSSGAHKKKSKEIEFSSGGGGGGGGSGSGSKPPVESLTTAQRQELQMKKAKLLNMLDEVEQRYKQYQTQMQVVISSFEQVSGAGSAKSYTSLALQTISRQFRCLKDAILSQIKTTAKTLGEENTNNSNNNNMAKVEGSALTNASRLKFIDHQLRQQRALHQLGVMHQHTAWRPQRGLPERAVSVLRAWLFEHFLHPYPKDSDKHILAKQTGLTRSQVSNWFINARVRLWKPMVEEMYMEEMKSQDQKGNNSDNNNNNNANPLSNDHNKDQSTSKTISTPQQHHQEQQPNNNNDGIIHHLPHQSENHPTNDMISNMSTMSTTSTQGFTLVGSSSDMESLMGRSPKKQRSGSDMQNSPSSILSMDMEIKSSYQINKYSQDPKNTPMISNGSGLNPYVIPDIGRFNPDQIGTHRYHQGNSVSLTLGLPHCENLPSLTNNEQHNFIQNQGIQLGRRIEIGVGEGEFCGISMGQSSHPSNVYDSIDIQSRKRFATQLLHDFVA